MLDPLRAGGDESSSAKTLGRIISKLGGIFQQAGIETAFLDARLLAAEACRVSAEESIANRNLVPSPESVELIENFALRRLDGEPVSRIIGRREFWGLTFRISPHTLDPRPESELLVESVLVHANARGLSGRPLRILDLGSGTGCLLSALLWELPMSTGVGVDRSQEALFTARENLSRLGLLDRAALLCGDWMNALSERAFDIIISNPPYVASREIDQLEREVQEHDPRHALDGGEDGLEAYRRIFAQAFNVLKGEGLMIVETGKGQAKAVREMMICAAPCSYFSEVQILSDLSGVDRAVAGVRQSVLVDPGSKKKIGNPALSG
jgi:release factor glutamine methyltransferase